METTKTELQEFNWELYTINPETKETGWDIKFASVIAESHEQAKEILKQWPLFDCIILHNYSTRFDAKKYPMFTKGKIFDRGSYRDDSKYTLLFEGKI